MCQNIKQIREKLITIHNRNFSNEMVVDGSKSLDLSVLFKSTDSGHAQKFDQILRLAICVEGATEAYEGNEKELERELDKLSEQLSSITKEFRFF